MSKWIKELMDILEISAATWDWDVFPKLERIDKLLRRAASGTDNNALHDDIRKELDNDSV
jgi:hypothetical protein